MGGIIGKLSKTVTGENDIFIPGCSPDKSGSSEGVTRLICNPKIIKDGKTFVGDHEVVLLVDDEKKIHIDDDGGVPAFVLERLRKHIERNI